MGQNAKLSTTDDFIASGYETVLVVNIQFIFEEFSFGVTWLHLKQRYLILPAL